MEITTKMIREQREFETMYKNPQHARAMWSQAVAERYAAPAIAPIAVYDKDGNLTKESQIEIAVWNHLVQELKNKGLDRFPSEGEVMEACQQYYARHNTSTYVAKRDSVGAKPIDETKQTVSMNNPLEGLTDEELLCMQKALDEFHHKQEVEQNESTKNEKLENSDE